ncbi:MAG TPA: hypothetical protein VGR73_07130 [Bryobacteraceae bacterium]|nr:hypothetical protein [Bryobacteraceae bacterium]
MRLRYVFTGVLVLAVLAGVVAKRVFYPSVSIRAASTIAGPGLSYLIVLGVNDTAPTVWDGTINVSGASIEILRGWRFKPGSDSLNGTTGWTMSTRTTLAIPPAVGPVQENGIIAKISVPAGIATFSVTTPHGNFSFSTADVSFGVNKTFLSGRALVTEVNAQFQLTTSDEEEDFPAMAQSGDDVYLTYTEFVHGDRTLAVGDFTPTPITDFRFLARPAGGDQVLLIHYSISTRTWTGPFAVTNTGEDAMRSAVAVDGQGRAWIFYSVQRSGNFDIYARSSAADGTMSPEIRLTTDPGTDIFPAAATDSGGRVWVTWQGFRNNNLEVLASAQNGTTFTPETIISTSPESDWDPAIATAPNGEVAISWDTYAKGDYDVYVRRVQFNGQIVPEAPIPIAATADFEARSSLAYDAQNRLWIAYEIAGSRWGKDFGAYDTTGLPLYSTHTIQVRCLVGNNLYTTTNDVSQALPGIVATRMFEPSTPGPFPLAPDPTLATNRLPNAGVVPPNGAKNSFPRLATDSDGTIYLAFRQLAGAGLSSSHSTSVLSVGSIWTGGMVWFDGAQWHGPGVLGFTDAVGDNRPSILALGPGHLLLAHSSDHRLSPIVAGSPARDGVNSDIFESELQIARAQVSPQLTPVGPAIPAPLDPSVRAEREALEASERYKPAVNGQRLQLVRGDFHRHTEISFDGRGDGPLIDSYRYFIDAVGLGWVGCCDHDNGDAREYTWWITQKFSDAYLLGAKFVPMYYYERSVSYPEGHRNVVFEQRGVRPLPRLPLSAVVASPPGPPAPDTTMLYAYLHFFNGLSAPHTSATDQGTDWRNSDPVVEPFVEIYQGDRQDYEMPGAPRANTGTGVNMPIDSISGYESPGYVSTALSRGVQLGFEASSDHISTHISFTNLWVTSPTRAGIMDAMRNRRMYGSTDNIVADFRSGTHFMGETFTTSTAPVFTVRLWGTQPFQQVVVVKDNNIVFSTSGGRAVYFNWQDTAAQSGKTSYYYVRGLQTDGNIVWVSPMWVTMQ